ALDGAVVLLDVAFEVEVAGVEKQVQEGAAPADLGLGEGNHPLAVVVAQVTGHARVGVPERLAFGLGGDPDPRGPLRQMELDRRDGEIARAGSRRGRARGHRKYE